MLTFVNLQNSIKEVKKDVQEFSDFVRNLPPVTSSLLTKEDIDRILAEDDDADTPEEKLAQKTEEHLEERKEGVVY